MKPSRKDGSRLCLALTPDGLTAYGNREAFASLREWLAWMEESDPREHFECHVAMSLEDEASRFERKRPRNVGVLISPELATVFPAKPYGDIGDELTFAGVELTFMMVTSEELDNLDKFQATGLLPDDWNRFEE